MNENGIVKSFENSTTKAMRILAKMVKVNLLEFFKLTNDFH